MTIVSDHIAEGTTLRQRCQQLTAASSAIWSVDSPDAERLRQMDTAPAMLIAGSIVSERVDILQKTYAAIVSSLAFQSDCSVDEYLLWASLPVVPFNTNEDTRKAKEALMAGSAAFRACSECNELFFLQNTSNAGRRQCLDCQRKIERNKKRLQRGTDLSQRTCEVCGAAFTPKRSHAKVCSAKCRAKLSRQKAKA